MGLKFHLQDMTVEEKMELMEAIWMDLSRHAEVVPVPNWHRDVLSAREAEIKSGAAVFEDWDSAKKRIERETD